ncbi:MAG: carboxypeptidase-like regulatory domain-containing protein [Verrucomicrobia bacterium]|nr:carboxypeptidase-like regulatory domain-containing protein [Verrucomicrobiota bacterium]
MVAQITTSGLVGRVIDDRGSAIANADVVVVHEPTGTRTTISTRGNGTFSVRGLRPGGPYTVSADAPGFVRGFQQNIFLDLGAEAEVTLALQSDEIIELEAFEVVGSSSDRFFASDRFGAGSQMGSEDIAAIPVGDRSLNSLLRLDPRIPLTVILLTGFFSRWCL